jgi:hypothetical protein
MTWVLDLLPGLDQGPAVVLQHPGGPPCICGLRLAVNVAITVSVVNLATSDTWRYQRTKIGGWAIDW